MKANDYAGGNTESTYDSGTSEDLQTYTRKTGVYPACWTIGSTAWGFTTYVLIQNPNSVAANITITYMTPNGPVDVAPFSMPAESRKTIRVNDDHPDTDISTRVHGDKPIIAERAMYWNVDTYLDDGTIITEEACHDSIGMSAHHRIFYLPDGQTSDGRETWILVQNPNDSQVEVEISFLTPTGQGNFVFTDYIEPNSRRTYNMSNYLFEVATRAGTVVECKTLGKKIMVERSMYWNNRGAGTDTIGGFSD